MRTRGVRAVISFSGGKYAIDSLGERRVRLEKVLLLVSYFQKGFFQIEILRLSRRHKEIVKNGPVEKRLLRLVDRPAPSEGIGYSSYRRPS